MVPAGEDPARQYEYDPDGKIKKMTGPDGDTTSYVNDELGRVAMISYSGNLTPSVEFAYDGNGNRTAMIDGAGTQSYTYDGLNRLTQVTQGTDSFGYEYDAAGNVTKRTYPDGMVISYSYDDDGHPVSVTTGTSTTSYEYNAAGALTKTTLPSSNGHVETRTYDRGGRLTDVTNAKGATTLSRAALTLDPAGNPTQVVTIQGTRTFKYGPKNELTEACFAASCTLPADPFIRYTYDAVGNRLTETRPAGTTTFDYNAGDQLLSKGGLGGSLSYTYDADGNQIAIGSRTFAYDVSNRLKSITLGSTTMTYTYDGDGKRVQASSGTQSAKKTNYLWDPNWGLPQLALERDGSNRLLRRYVHGNDLISMTSGTSDYYFHYDAIGSVANLTSSTGVAQWTYDYEPFGALRTETKHLTKAPTNLMKFTGELFDADTGLYHLRVRQYDPVQGRFGATDPLSKALTDPYVAAYVYAANRPLVLVDPSGLCELKDWTSPWDCVVDAVVNQNTSDFFAGWGDAASFGATSWVRDRLGVNDVVNECSRYYMAGEITGYVNVAAIGAAGGARAAGIRAKTALHGPHHTFPMIGARRHIQTTIWREGVKGSGQNIRIPY